MYHKIKSVMAFQSNWRYYQIKLTLVANISKSYTFNTWNPFNGRDFHNYKISWVWQDNVLGLKT